MYLFSRGIKQSGVEVVSLKADQLEKEKEKTTKNRACCKPEEQRVCGSSPALDSSL